ncbi:GDSL esterase/lipase At5g62930 [Aegilops tauschii subsp. strangulata]|uniref:SGNH hydrolase-type esterase domain-containing protein n=1 Tax=Aegilops tauschii subsp. strangulata TaxID=200361 RepID=A0A453QFD6_AEGTS|nr:GDSL esterase/lipase At5g62930 [Aegilops tauschii subsp. strangulata]
MAVPGSCPSTVAPSAGHPPICLADASGGAGSQDMLRPHLVLFGDSITEQSFRPGGWGAALADTYSRKADIVVRGYGGYNSRWALFLIQRIFPLVGLPPVATTIFFGANDAALPGRTSQRQHVPVEEYRQNLKTIVNHLKDCSKSMVILLITPPPIDEDGRERYARSQYGEDARRLPERTNEMAGVYAGQCIELAKEMDVQCVDLWSKMQATEGWQKLYLSDGLHLTPEGNALVHKEVVQTLRGAGLKAEDMPHDFPHHSKIDGVHPERAFQ